jgi:hypothetical protein
MGFLVHKLIYPLVRKCSWGFRFGALTLKDENPYCNAVVFGVHGPHEDAIVDFLAGLTCEMKKAPQNASIVFVGDWNIDQLPMQAGDPWAGPGREDRHFDKRMILDTWLESNRLCLHIPGQYVSFALPWLDQQCSAAITRFPPLNSGANPSLLDYACARQEAIRGDGMIHAEAPPGDHALILFDFCFRGRDKDGKR